MAGADYRHCGKCGKRFFYHPVINVNFSVRKLELIPDGVFVEMSANAVWSKIRPWARYYVPAISQGRQ